MNIARLTCQLKAPRSVAPNPGISAPSRPPQQNLRAICDLLNAACAQALPNGRNAYLAAAQVRDAVILTVLEGGTSARLDLADALALELAALGFTCMSSGTPQTGHHDLTPSGAALTLESSLAASRHGLRQCPLQQALRMDGTPVSTALEFSPRQITDIIAGNGPDGISDLFEALSEGNAAAVTAFMSGLKDLGLEAHQIADIVTARDSLGDPGLFLTFCGLHTATLTAFMEGLKGLCLNPTQIASILAARDSAMTPGLYAVLHDGHAALVTAFMDGLDGLGLNPEQVACLVAAREPNAPPGLYFARRNGHTDAVDAYILGLSRLYQRQLITAQQFADIVAAA